MLARLLLVCCAVSIAALPTSLRRGRPHKHLAASAFERSNNKPLKRASAGKSHDGHGSVWDKTLGRPPKVHDLEQFYESLTGESLTGESLAGDGLFDEFFDEFVAGRDELFLEYFGDDMPAYESESDGVLKIRVKEMVRNAVTDGRLAAFQDALCDRIKARAAAFELPPAHLHNQYMYYGCWTMRA